MKVGSEPKVHEQQQVEAPEETKDAKGPEEKDSPKGADQGDTFEDSKPQGKKDIRDKVAECEAANAGKPQPVGTYSWKDAEEELQKTDEGKAILEDWKKLQAKGPITVEDHNFCAADGGPHGAWQAGSRTIQVDPQGYKTVDGYLQTVVHEMTHAAQTDGLDPERNGATKTMDQFDNSDAWADHAMEMEVRADARAYDLSRDRHFDKSSTPKLRAIYDRVMDSGTGTVEERREAAIKEMLAAIKNGQADDGWQSERQTYANDWTKWRNTPVAGVE